MSTLNDQRLLYAKSAAEEVFKSFMKATNHLRPDGGERRLIVDVEVRNIDHNGYGCETRITMTEEIYDKKTEVFCAVFKDR